MKKIKRKYPYLLSVICPILNEEFFLPMYLQAVSSYADEILLLDGGSHDNSLKIIKDFQQKSTVDIRYWQIPQQGLPYSNDWQEGLRRNFLLERSRGKWVLALDVDEFLSDNFREFFRKDIINDTKTLVFGFHLVSFWRDLFTIRLNVEDDPHWEGEIFRLYRRKAASYNSCGNHCSLLINNLHPIVVRNKRVIKEIKLFHYHYALGARIKQNDNRRADLGCLESQDNPDFNYQTSDYSIKTRVNQIKHPIIVRNYLKGMIK